MFWLLNCLGLVQSCILICEESRNLWISHKTLKKFGQGCILFENPPFGGFGLFFWLFGGQFWISLIAFWSPHALWLVPLCSLICYKSITPKIAPITLKDMSQDYRLLWELLILLVWPFPPAFNVSDGFFGVFLVSDWFHEVPWHMRSP